MNAAPVSVMVSPGVYPPEAELDAINGCTVKFIESLTSPSAARRTAIVAVPPATVDGTVTVNCPAAGNDAVAPSPFTITVSPALKFSPTPLTVAPGNPSLGLIVCSQGRVSSSSHSCGVIMAGIIVPPLPEGPSAPALPLAPLAPPAATGSLLHSPAPPGVPGTPPCPPDPPVPGKPGSPPGPPVL